MPSQGLSPDQDIELAAFLRAAEWRHLSGGHTVKECSAIHTSRPDGSA
jgi:hypothetical protein